MPPKQIDTAVTYNHLISFIAKVDAYPLDLDLLIKLIEQAKAGEHHTITCFLEQAIHLIKTGGDRD